MKVFKITALMGASLLVMATAHVSMAANYDAEVEQKLDTILRTENDVENAKVRIEVEPKDTGAKMNIDFSELDMNKDGVFEKGEVGEKLFSIFDRDGNGVIDNIEMKKIALKVNVPMEKKTIEVVDYSTPGKEQKTTITQEDFIKETRLSKFDKDSDGLSPLDFLGMTFYRVDVKRDGVIDLYEWKRAYAESIKPLHIEPFNYNR